VVCEVKQIEPNDEDHAERSGKQDDRGRLPEEPHPAAPEVASIAGGFRSWYTDAAADLRRDGLSAVQRRHGLIQAMFRRNSIEVGLDANGERQHSEPFFGGDRGMTANSNTSVSAVGCSVAHRLLQSVCFGPPESPLV
jgi:hypothetical protein